MAKNTSTARPAPKGAPVSAKSTTAPTPPGPKLTPTQIEMGWGQLLKMERDLKAALDKAESSKEKDRLKALLDDLDERKAEWKKGVYI